MDQFGVDRLLEYIKTDCESRIIKNKFLLDLRFFSRFEEARECFHNHIENEDFFEMIEEIGQYYNQPDFEVYAHSIEARYPIDGRFFKGSVERFCAALAMYELTKEDIK
jgi:hypothetical protein